VGRRSRPSSRTSRARSRSSGAHSRATSSASSGAGSVSPRASAALAETLDGARGRGPRVAVALTAVGELALLLGDELRARAQARLAALPPEAQASALDALGTPAPADGRHARVIADAIEALLADLEA